MKLADLLVNEINGLTPNEHAYVLSIVQAVKSARIRDALTVPKDQIKSAALDAFRARVESQPAHIDNSAAIAGADMIFYCRACGHVCDTKPEAYLFPPYQHCSECRGLIAEGWISP